MNEVFVSRRCKYFGHFCLFIHTLAKVSIASSSANRNVPRDYEGKLKRKAQIKVIKMWRKVSNGKRERVRGQRGRERDMAICLDFSVIRPYITNLASYFDCFVSVCRLESLTIYSFIWCMHNNWPLKRRKASGATAVRVVVAFVAVKRGKISQAAFSHLQSGNSCLALDWIGLDCEHWYNNVFVCNWMILFRVFLLLSVLLGVEKWKRGKIEFSRKSEQRRMDLK